MTALLLLHTAVRAAGQSAADKLDQGIVDARQRHSIFVRMEDQLIGRSGDHERFCQEHAGARRLELRKQVVQTLRNKADQSWEQVAGLVAGLEKSGQVGFVERFWIVNGFACGATAEACRKLAATDAVSFVYLQRGPLRQQKRAPKPAGSQVTTEQEQQFRRVLAGWKDDSDEPFSTKGLQVSWNLQAIQADAAWKEEKATGRGVVVALLDSGLLPAPALTHALWKNPGEVFNGKDDDGDGHVDDVFGYNFQADNYNCIGDSDDKTHGSMCAGIVAGRPINRMKLITGVAPRAHLMILRGMGFLKAYEYALSHGADVISMSYMWIDVELGHYRGVFRTAHEHLSAAGIVAVGGAGNFSGNPPGKQIALPKDIPCLIAVAGITRDGRKAPASSEGPCTWQGVKFYDDYPPRQPLSKPDVTALFTGFAVWGRPADGGGNWRVYSQEADEMGLVIGPGGNSFAGPHAAGVAALMLSANLELCAWEVKSLMEETCRDIGPKGRDYTFGAGLLQARDAVRAARKVTKRN